MRLKDSTVAVVGLGLMGGSLAMALRGHCLRVVGIARRSEVAQLALSLGVVDDASCDLDSIGHADIVVLATPIRHILAAIPKVASVMRHGALLMDLGSTKVQVVEAMNTLPDGIEAIGGHPMCGKETGGLESAEADLFRGVAFVLTPTQRTTDGTMSLALELIEAIGAKPVVLAAETHDRAVAAISHLPYLLAASLVHAETEANAEDHISDRLAASGFRDTTRLAASSLDMMLDILLTNRRPVRDALDRFERQLAGLKALLDDEEGLRTWMAAAQYKRKGMY